MSQKRLYHIIFIAQIGQKGRYTMANNTTILSGKVQWNSKEAKAFRDTMATWHIFDFELSDRMKTRSNAISMCNGVIAADREKIAKQEYIMHDEAWYLADIASMEARIADAKAELRVWKEGQEESVKKAEKLFTVSMYNAYVTAVNDGNDNAWRTSAYTEALAEMLSENGIAPTWDILDKLYHANAKTKGTGKTKNQTGKHNRAVGISAWRAVVMGEICDQMGDILPVYKWTNVFVKKAEKSHQ